MQYISAHLFASVALSSRNFDTNLILPYLDMGEFWTCYFRGIFLAGFRKNKGYNAKRGRVDEKGKGGLALSCFSSKIERLVILYMRKAVKLL